MSVFRQALNAHRPAQANRRWIFVSYDQLSDALGPLATQDPRELGIILVECPNKAARRPYHQQKLALVLSSLRHFALEQAARGVAVRHVVSPSYAQAIEELVPELGAIEMSSPAERELRMELAPLFASKALRELPHDGWLTNTADFLDSQQGPPWRMDVFYKHVRKKQGVLMERGKPVGGRFSFDTENRRAWRGDPPAPVPPTFVPDELTLEVASLVREHYSDHPGVLRPEKIAATLQDVERAWAWSKDQCLPMFGPYEDAMSIRSRTLFHTQLSPLLNLQRLSVKRALKETLALELPLPSKEGFVRQILGWREYVKHIHDATDGFRTVFGEAQPIAENGGADPSILGARRPLPDAYWDYGKKSGLRCLDEVVRAVWDDGYSHHITRLMVLSNLAMLLDVSPRELTDWFWVAYVDAYDWVVEPNVLGMGTFGAGDLMTTKPYIGGSAYINKMSDYCKSCRFDPKSTCPITPLYWAYLGRHRNILADVDRMKIVMSSEAARTTEQKRAAAEVFATVSAALAEGRELIPEDV